MAERELEQQRKQHHVAMDKLLLQIQGLEQALQRERHVVTEERWANGTRRWNRCDMPVLSEEATGTFI